MYKLNMLWGYIMGFPGMLVVKNQPAKAGDVRDSGDPWSERFPGGGHGNSLQYFLPGESHGQRSPVGYSS